MNIKAFAPSISEYKYTTRNVFIVIERGKVNGFVGCFTNRKVLYEWIIGNGTAYFEHNRKPLPVTSYAILVRYIARYNVLYLNYLKMGQNVNPDAAPHLYYEIIKTPVINGKYE